MPAKPSARRLGAIQNYSLDRALTQDSQVMRYAEEWVRRRINDLDVQMGQWLYREYVAAYQTLLDKLGQTYNADGTVNQARRAELMRQIDAELLALYQRITPVLDEAFIQAFRQGMTGRAWMLDQATLKDVTIRLPLLPREAIVAQLTAPYYGKPWHEDLGYSFNEYIARIKSSLSQSLITGESMAQAQRRLKSELGIQTDRRKGFNRNFYRTLMITRTEIMRASNLGALAIYEQNADILSGWEWVATKDERTCPICGALDGKVFKFGDPMMAPPSGSHIGCRCTPVPMLKDVALMTRVAGVRQTYKEWKAARGITQDGGLQKAA